MARKKLKSPHEPRPTEAAGQDPAPETEGDAPARRAHEALGIVTLASGLLLGPSLVSVQLGDGTLMGPFGLTVGSALNEAMGLTGHAVVLTLLVVALRIFAGGLHRGERASARHTLWRERAGVPLGLLAGAVLLHLMVRPHRIGGASAGGLVGELGAELLRGLVSTPGAWVVALSLLAVSLVLSTSLSWARLGLALGRLLASLVRGLADAGRTALQSTAEALGDLASVLRRRPLPSEGGCGTLALPPVIRLDLTHDHSGEDMEVLRVAEPAPRPAPLPHDLEIGLEPAPEPEQTPAPEPPAPDASPAEPAPAVPLTIVEPRYERADPALPETDGSEGRHVDQTDGPGFVLHGDTYRPPPLSLLESVPETECRQLDRDAIYAQADRLVKTLSDYKIEGRITEVHPGPVVTMYEFVPAPGTRISKVASLNNDLAMSLAAQRVRIVAPIPGKGAIGIEVPNKTRETVYFKEIVASDAFRKSKSRLALALGKNIFGAPVAMDLSKMPHLLVAGATGAGKSVSVNAMICSLLMSNTPEEVRMIMVDPKFLELSGYNDIPHLLLPVVTDPKKANIALRWAVNEMERRYQLLADFRVRDIRSYNRKVDKLRGRAEAELRGEEPPEPEEGAEPMAETAPSKVVVVRRLADGSEEPLLGPTSEDEPLAPDEAGDPGEADLAETLAERQARARRELDGMPRRLPYIVVVIDEFADLMMVASKEVETSVARLAQKARAAGLHVILATQRPSVDVITGLIKANFPSRVSFQVASNHDSKTILGTHGAENLLGSGDMLVLDRGADMKRLHGAYISDAEIQRIIDWLKEQGRPIYDMDILRVPDDGDEEGAVHDDEVTDAMYDMAVALVAETRQASISMIQRRLRVGYNRAARMVERMERDGIVGPPDGVRGREVLVPQLPPD